MNESDLLTQANAGLTTTREDIGYEISRAGLLGGWVGWAWTMGVRSVGAEWCRGLERR